MTPKPPKCPACGSTKVVPILHGYPTAEAEESAQRGEIVLGGCMVRGGGSDPEWACRKCGKEFGGFLTPADPATWSAVIRTMLPAPVTDTEEGIVGGDPGEVVVKISDNGIEVGVFRVEWNVQIPEVVIKDWKHLPLDARPAAVSRAIQAARARRIRTYRWCTLCHEMNPPEWIERGRCYACMEKNGVIF